MLDEILVPATVYEEVAVKGAGRPGSAAIDRVDWLRVVSPRSASTIEPIKGTLGVLLAAVLAGLLSKAEALDGLQQLANSEIRISPRWQAWLKDELDKL